MIDEIEKRTAQREHDVAQREITRLNQEIGKLMRQRGEQETIVARSRLTMAGIEPCRACGRHVQSPCHDRGGYQESGPWDGSCRATLYGDD